MAALRVGLPDEELEALRARAGRQGRSPEDVAAEAKGSSPTCAAERFAAGCGTSPSVGSPARSRLPGRTEPHDGRAILTYGAEVRPGHQYVIWLRIGDHRILP
jgi:hypothetical protein